MRGRTILLLIAIAALIGLYFAAPILPYPDQYCAKHPHNKACIVYRPDGI